MAEPVDLVGVIGGDIFGPAAAEAVAGAEVVIGAPRHLSALRAAVAAGAEQIELGGRLDSALEAAAAAADAGRRVCLLVSGDPGFFGLGRLAAARFGPERLRVHPAPSAVALAFARSGVNWDDALVVSTHGRDPAPAVDAAARAAKVAVLCSPECPPQEIGRRLLAGGVVGRRRVTVAARLGEADEVVWSGDVDGLAAGRWDGLAVVVLRPPPLGGGGPASSARATPPGRAEAVPPGGVGPAVAVWGRPETDFAHRDGMITKAEVRAVALGKLTLPEGGVMWDVGAGSGSVSAEAARLVPGLRVFAVERGGTEDLAANTAGSAVTVVAGEAPAALADLPDPDRVFVGGGGLAVLDACLARLRPGGTVVATFASPARAAAGWERLGSMVQIAVNRAVPIAGGGMRLAGENPVFVCWGPTR